jgi:hypothetical protein
MKQFSALIIFLIYSVVSNANSPNDSLLQVLVKAIDEKEIPVNQKIKRIEYLRELLKRERDRKNPDLFKIYNALFQENRKFVYDSAFYYATLLTKTAHEQRDPQRIGIARAQLGYILVSSGFFKDAFDTLLSVQTKYLPDSVKPSFYALVARGCYDLGDFNNDAYFKKHYFALGNIYTDSAKALCTPNTYYDLYLSRIKYIKTENYSAALKESEAVRKLFKLANEDQAVNFFDLSHAYHESGDDEKAIEYLIHSALADLRAATKETAAMHALAKLLYEKGQVDYAYAFIQQAMDDATYYGARQRQIQISSILPLIASAKLNSVEEQKTKWLSYSFALSILIVLTVIFAAIIWKQLRKLKTAELTIKAANHELMVTNKSLVEANKIKEEYIGYYFNINAEYLNKIEAFKKSVDQKLSARRFEELRSIVDHINVKREREELSYSFDHVFLGLFPDFVSNVNSFFKPEDRIILKEGQLLNTELRIFALIRMGIHDPEKIARILGYSVNTIYAYKTRVKSKSILPNDEFERKIMEISAA